MSETPDEQRIDDFLQYAMPFDPGVIEWDVRLLDGWKPL